MKIYIIYILIININNVDLYFIQNQNKKICANCKFLIPGKDECSKFGKIDIITGDYDYNKAIIIREDETKCGTDAIFFEQNYFKFITIFLNFIYDNFLLIIFINYFLLFFFNHRL